MIHPRPVERRAVGRYGIGAGNARKTLGAASPFVCLRNMSDDQVNVVLGLETHTGADKKIGDAGNDKNKQRDRTIRSYSKYDKIRRRSLME